MFLRSARRAPAGRVALVVVSKKALKSGEAEMW